MTKAEEQLIAMCVGFLDEFDLDREAIAKVRKAAAEVAAERVSPEQLDLLRAALRQNIASNEAFSEARRRAGIPSVLLEGEWGLIAKWYDEFNAEKKP